MKPSSLACALTLLLATGVAAAAQTTRDPFRRPAAVAGLSVAPPQEAPRLRAVVLNGAASLANLDGAVLAVGDAAAGWTVLRIDARGVLVERAGRRQLLTMQDKETP